MRSAAAAPARRAADPALARRVYCRAAGRDQTGQPDSAANHSLLLTVPEACAALRISRWSFYRLVQQRRLRTVRIGNRRLVPAAALAELIAELSQQEEA